MLKKLFAASITVLFLFAGGLNASQKTAVKLSLTNSIYTPKKDMVKGLDFGVLSTKTKKVEGVQFSFICGKIEEKSEGLQIAVWAKSQNYGGAKIALISLSDNVTGYQAGVANSNNSIKGLQTGIVNVSDEVTGVQIGLVNLADKMNGVQIGIFNVIRESKLPFMLIANAKFK